MKKLKKLLFLFSVCAMAFGVAACGGGEKEDSSSVVEDSSSVVEDSSSVVEDSSSVVVEDPFAAYETITVAEALELCGEKGTITQERYYILATIDSITNAQYGAMIISDETGSISVYGTYSADGEINYSQMESKPYKGDTVLLHCILQNYNGDKEVKNARLIAFKTNEITVDEGDYAEMNIADARNAQKGALVKTDGVVAKITYADGMKPSGVYLVDETQSIYVYDGDLAARVAVGNKISILASKDYWVLASEQSNAEKHGYIGCCQLTEAHLLSNDEGNNDFDKAWVEENTIKAIMQTPVSENITTTIYKVNALVKKVEGKGFTNYYFYDIDGETGSYTYTQCSGADFAWLDQFDGKICTVYLSVINAKSTASDCLYRFLPIEVIDENYVFDSKNAAQFAVEYYALDQFESKYTADPAIQLITSVSSELLGFENVTLAYASDNTAVVSIQDGVLHCGQPGTANVTITGAYNGTEYTKTITITVEEPVSYEYITVAEAIATAEDTEVTVKGIVGPSLVNRDGFYLFGEDGSMISVIVASTTVLGEVELGNEVILKGQRDVRRKNETDTDYYGQTYINFAELLVNNYGTHEYSTAKFIESTVADFYNLDVLQDNSTNVFVLKATVTMVETPFYTNLKVGDGSTEISLYGSGAAQYAWLQAFVGQEVTMEIAACNWNGKSYWAGCVLAVRTQDGKIYNTLNFDTH